MGQPRAQESQKVKNFTYSILDHYHLRLMVMDDMRHWQEALKDHLVARVHIA